MNHQPTEDGPAVESPAPSSDHELLTTLFDLGRQVSGVLELDELLQQIPRLIRRLIPFDALAVYLLDEKRGELRIAYSVGYPEQGQAKTLRQGQGLVGAAVENEQALLVNDLPADARYIEVVPGMHSEIVVPLVHKSRPIGALNLLSPNPNQFTHRDVSILSQFGVQVASALVNARLYERSRLDAEAFETLAEIGARSGLRAGPGGAVHANRATDPPPHRLPNVRHLPAQRPR